MRPAPRPSIRTRPKGLSLSHLALQRELNEYEESTFSRRPHGYSLLAAATHWMSASFMSCTAACSIRLGNGRESRAARIRIYACPGSKFRCGCAKCSATFALRLSIKPTHLWRLLPATIIASSPFMCSRTATVDTPALWRICSSLNSQDGGSNGAAARW